MNGHQNLPDYNSNSPLPCCLIVDLDGTLACNRSGRYIYGDDVHLDDVRLFVKETVEALAQLPKIEKVFIFSGREGRPAIVSNTMLWLRTVCQFSDTVKRKLEVHFRPKKDFRSDAEVKMDMYNIFVKDKYTVFAVFDDRATVIRLCWKTLNLPVFRCGLIDEDEF